MSAAMSGLAPGCPLLHAPLLPRSSPMISVHGAPLSLPLWPCAPSTSGALKAHPRGVVVAQARRKAYAVYMPEHARGIYKVWDEVRDLILGVSGALHQGFPSMDAALKWLLEQDLRYKEKDAELQDLRDKVRQVIHAPQTSRPAATALANRTASSGTATSAHSSSASSATNPNLQSSSTGPDSQARTPDGLQPWDTPGTVLEIASEPSRVYYRKWYAVRFVDGGYPGVYNSWEDAQDAIQGRYAEFRSFHTYEQATEYAFGAEAAEQLTSQAMHQRALEQQPQQAEYTTDATAAPYPACNAAPEYSEQQQQSYAAQEHHSGERHHSYEQQQQQSYAQEPRYEPTTAGYDTQPQAQQQYQQYDTQPQYDPSVFSRSSAVASSSSSIGSAPSHLVEQAPSWLIAALSARPQPRPATPQFALAAGDAGDAAAAQPGYPGSSQTWSGHGGGGGSAVQKRPQLPAAPLMTAPMWLQTARLVACVPSAATAPPPPPAGSPSSLHAGASEGPVTQGCQPPLPPAPSQQHQPQQQQQQQHPACEGATGPRQEHGCSPQSQCDQQPGPSHRSEQPSEGGYAGLEESREGQQLGSDAAVSASPSGTSSPPLRRPRGRPRGSTKQQRQAEAPPPTAPAPTAAAAAAAAPAPPAGSAAAVSHGAKAAEEVRRYRLDALSGAPRQVQPWLPYILAYYAGGSWNTRSETSARDPSSNSSSGGGSSNSSASASTATPAPVEFSALLLNPADMSLLAHVAGFRSCAHPHEGPYAAMVEGLRLAKRLGVRRLMLAGPGLSGGELTQQQPGQERRQQAGEGPQGSLERGGDEVAAPATSAADGTGSCRAEAPLVVSWGRSERPLLPPSVQPLQAEAIALVDCMRSVGLSDDRAALAAAAEVAGLVRGVRLWLQQWAQLLSPQGLQQLGEAVEVELDQLLQRIAALEDSATYSSSRSSSGSSGCCIEERVGTAAKTSAAVLLLPRLYEETGCSEAAAPAASTPSPVLLLRPCGGAIGSDGGEATSSDEQQRSLLEQQQQQQRSLLHRRAFVCGQLLERMQELWGEQQGGRLPGKLPSQQLEAEQQQQPQEQQPQPQPQPLPHEPAQLDEVADAAPAAAVVAASPPARRAARAAASTAATRAAEVKKARVVRAAPVRAKASKQGGAPPADGGSSDAGSDSNTSIRKGSSKNSGKSSSRVSKTKSRSRGSSDAAL